MVRDSDIRSAVRRAGDLKPVAFRICAGFWAVQSQSEPNSGYLLEISEGKVRCECKAFEHRGVCVHSAVVAIEEGIMPTRFLLEPLPPTPEDSILRAPAGLHGRRSLYGQEGA